MLTNFILNVVLFFSFVKHTIQIKAIIIGYSIIIKILMCVQLAMHGFVLSRLIKLKLRLNQSNRIINYEVTMRAITALQFFMSFKLVMWNSQTLHCKYSTCEDLKIKLDRNKALS